MYFVIENGVLKKYNGTEENVIIPDGVTEIGEGAFEGCSSIKSITIPEGVTKIGMYAFYGCSGLTSITIPENVTEIGDSAFSGCSSLTSITIPEGVTEIGDSAFEGCSSLTSLTIPESVTEIGEWAFEDCSGLTSINIPESVTKIGGRAFWGCSSLTSITIPESVTEIGDNAFSRCSSLKKIVVDKNNLAYFSCDGVLYSKNMKKIIKYPENNRNTDFFIPKDVTEIGAWAFSRCSNLKSITIPESVTIIEKGAFEGCSSLTSITIPEGVTNVEGLINQTDIFIPITAPHISVSDVKDSKMKQALSFGYAVAVNQGINVSDKNSLAYKKYIKSHRKDLFDDILIAPEMLYLMIEEQMLDKKDVDFLIDIVTKSGRTELTAVLLEYINESKNQKDTAPFDSLVIK